MSPKRLSKMKQNNKTSQDRKWVHLNVGGTSFTTTGATLVKGTPPNSPLHRISTNSTNVEWDRDDRGAYMIDRDPSYFQVILNYLRHGNLVLHKNVPEEAILIEAEYYHVPELVKLIRERTLKQLLEQQQQRRVMFKGQHLMDYPQDYLTSYVNYILENEA